GMGIAWGDYNRDGWFDIYVGNMFSAAGSRIVPQREFKPGVTNDLRQKLAGFARGNTLLKNQNGEFEDVSRKSATSMGRWAWGTQFLDINNDGWDDLVVANGYVTGNDSGDL
ncbi:MAG: VCBS repeat-containing protein, partial [Fuerstiella sp.]|nr:VCBS repeat-containing protein [Fuerstiella sp.]